jgi:hypothetical protein
MIDKSKLAVTAASAASGMALPASAGFVRHFGSLMSTTARRLYHAHLERVQMRLAPTKCVD